MGRAVKADNMIESTRCRGSSHSKFGVMRSYLRTGEALCCCEVWELGGAQSVIASSRKWPVRCLCAACARGAVFTSDPYQAIPYQDTQKNKVMNFHKPIHHHRSIVRMCWQEDNFSI